MNFLVSIFLVFTQMAHVVNSLWRVWKDIYNCIIDTITSSLESWEYNELSHRWSVVSWFMELLRVHNGWESRRYVVIARENFHTKVITGILIQTSKLALIFLFFFYIRWALKLETHRLDLYCWNNGSAWSLLGFLLHSVEIPFHSFLSICRSFSTNFLVDLAVLAL